MPRDGRQRAERGSEHANRQRDRMQQQASGRRTEGGLGERGRAQKVEITRGQDAFFNKLAETLGITTQRHGGGSQGKGFGELLGSMGKFSQSLEKVGQAIVSSQQAQQAAHNSYLAELKATNQTLRDLRSSLGDALRGNRPVPPASTARATPDPPPRPAGPTPVYRAGAKIHRRDDEHDYGRHTHAVPNLDDPDFPRTLQDVPPMPPGGGEGGGGRGRDGAVKVEVARGSREFIDQLVSALGGGAGGSGGGGGGGPAMHEYWQRREDRDRESQAARQATELRKHITSYQPGTDRLKDSSVRHNMGSLRSNVLGRAGEYMHQRWGQGDERTPTAYPVHDEDGAFVGYRYSFKGQHWNINTGQATNAAGALLTPGMTGFAGAAQAARQGGTMTGIAGALGGAGVSAALRAIPGVGTALSAAVGVGKAVNEGAEWLTTQRGKNTGYQSIYGTTDDQNTGGGAGLADIGSFFKADASDSRSGLGNRLAEEGYVYANRFGIDGLKMDETSARTAFRGVSELGFTGAARGDMLAPINDLYKNQGVSPDQSLKWLRIATQQAAGDLSNMTSVFDSVSKAANMTNQNANQLRETLIGNYQQLSPQFGTGAGGLAAALTLETQGVSRAWSGVSDASQLSNPVTGSLIAQRAGYSGLGAMEAAGMSGKTDGILKAQGQFNAEVMQTLLPQSAKAAMDAYAQAHGGVKAVMASPGALTQLGQEGLAALGNIPPSLLRQSAARFGVQIDASTGDADMMAKLWSYTVGGGPGGANAPGQSTENKGVKLAGGALSGFLDASTSDASGFGGGPGGMALKSAASKAAKAGGAGEDYVQGNIEAYQGLVESHGGVTSPTMSKLIDELGTDENTGIMVSTAKGSKVMSVQDAIKYAPDQVASGNATIVGGKYDGKKVSSVAGQDTNLAGAYGNSVQMDAGTGDGTSTGDAGAVANEWKKGHTSDQTPGSNKGGTVGGKITLDLTDAAKSLVVPSTSGNVNYSNSQGTVPTPVGGPLK